MTTPTTMTKNEIITQKNETNIYIKNTKHSATTKPTKQTKLKNVQLHPPMYPHNSLPIAPDVASCSHTNNIDEIKKELIGQHER